MEKKKALTISFFAILSVVFVEGVGGLVTGSLAILSDVAHALFDAATSLILLLTTSWSLKPPDEEHMYGHEKIESMGGFAAGMALLILAGFIATRSIWTIAMREILVHPELIGFVGILYTLCIDFIRIGTLRKSKESVTAEAGLYHAFADFASTIIALLGFGLATIGFYYGDPAASIILSLSLMYLSIRLVRKSAMELSDAISADIVRRVKRQILETPNVSQCKGLKVRKAGHKTFVEATVIVPEHIELKDAHIIASEIESNIAKSIGNSEVTIHIEPEEKETSTQKQIEDIVMAIMGVKRAHNVSYADKKGKLYITLHAQMDPKFPLKKAHEITEKIENELKSKIQNVKNVTVHIEPYSKATVEGALAEEAEIHKIVTQAVKECPDVLRINRIVTYLDKGKRYINVDCSFDSNTSIGAIHEVVSETEKRIRKKLENTVVTIHSEPEIRHLKSG